MIRKKVTIDGNEAAASVVISRTCFPSNCAIVAVACMGLSLRPSVFLKSTMTLGAAGVARGAYVLADSDRGTPDVLLIASGTGLLPRRGQPSVWPMSSCFLPALALRRPVAAAWTKR